MCRHVTKGRLQGKRVQEAWNPITFGPDIRLTPANEPEVSHGVASLQGVLILRAELGHQDLWDLAEEQVEMLLLTLRGLSGHAVIDLCLGEATLRGTQRPPRSA